MKEGQGLLILLLFPAILLLGAPFEAKGNNQPICFPSFSWLLEYILPPSCCKSITILLTAPSVMSSPQSVPAEAWGVLSIWASQVCLTCFRHSCSSPQGLCLLCPHPSMGTKGAAVWAAACSSLLTSCDCVTSSPHTPHSSSPRTLCPQDNPRRREGQVWKPSFVNEGIEEPV